MLFSSCSVSYRAVASGPLFRQFLNPKIVQEILGHANISVTMDTYSHELPDMQGEAVAAIEGLFS
jgi:integrase